LSEPSTNFRELNRGMPIRLADLRTSTPEVMKRFGESGRAATSDGMLGTDRTRFLKSAAAINSPFARPFTAFGQPTTDAGR